MWIALTILILSLLVVGVYLFCLMGRRNHRNMRKLKRWKYAHRGLHDSEKPENSMAAFRAALEDGYGIELDVHLLKDGNLAVIHDYDLQRVTGREGKVENLTVGELTDYSLNGTDQTIPRFEDVLALFHGKAPLIVEVKCDNNNHAALCEAVCKVLDDYDGLYCIESFDPRAIRWMKENRPDIVRGQLSENWMGKELPIPGILKWMLTYHLMNVYTRPDFIAYRFEDRKTFGTDICRKFLKVPGVSWTIKSKEDFDTAVAEGWIPIFEGFKP